MDSTSDIPLAPDSEFQEIAHSGGKVTFRIRQMENGERAYQVSYSGCRPNRMVMIDLLAHNDGTRVTAPEPNKRPPAGWFLVMLASDSEGRFGHECPNCNGYWRSGPCPSICPYCGFHAQWLLFFTKAQKRYVSHWCKMLREALEADADGDHVIDLDAVADAVGKDGPKPPFYYAEQSQQNQFTCGACGEFNDVLGRFVYCAHCATRNDLTELEGKILPAIRERINAGGQYESCVRDTVAAFDAFGEPVCSGTPFANGAYDERPCGQNQGDGVPRFREGSDRTQVHF